MFVHYRTTGLIFKKDDRGETDQLFTVYTKDFGKLEILGKAIRKISSKLRSGAELFYLSEIEFIQGKTQKTLTDAILIEKFKNLREDLKTLSVAYKISEILDNLIKGQEPDEKIWQLLLETFERLNNYTLYPKTYTLIYYYFLWNLLSILGYQPELYNCVICQKNLSTYFAEKYGLDRAQMILCSGLLPEKLYLNPKEGGLICQNCFKKVNPVRKLKLSNGVKLGIIEIKPEVVKILRIILKKNWLTLSKLKIEKDFLKELVSISKNYLSFICEENSSSS